MLLAPSHCRANGRTGQFYIAIRYLSALSCAPQYSFPKLNYSFWNFDRFIGFDRNQRKNSLSRGAIMASDGVSRRGLLSVGVAIGSVAVSGRPTEARSIRGDVPWEPAEAAAPAVALPSTPLPAVFFTSDERAFVDAAVSRLIPKDELGAGAKEAGVTTFLDRQLAGSYGKARTWYMQGPWSEGTPSQGNQSRLTPAQTYRAAIKSIDTYCSKTFKGKEFVQLPENEQDEILSQLEKGGIELEGVKSKSFFEAFLQNTLEGFWSDPVYGGNHDMVGWKLIGFPGTRYDYRDYVSKHGEKLALAPVGLKSLPQD